MSTRTIPLGYVPVEPEMNKGPVKCINGNTIVFEGNQKNFKITNLKYIDFNNNKTN